MPVSLLDLTVLKVLTLHPETLPVFVANGLETFADPEVRASFGAAVRLRTALKAAGSNPELFLGQLLEAIAASRPRSGNESSSGPGQQNLNLLALLPCPLKVPLEQAFHGFLAALPAQQRDSITYCIEGNANSQIDYADYAEIGRAHV